MIRLTWEALLEKECFVVSIVSIQHNLSLKVIDEPQLILAFFASDKY